MTKASTELESYISRVRLVGDLGEELVKKLPGWRKGRHTLPEALTPATQAFFARLCGERISAEAEAWFQRARTELSYKRKELTLEVTSPGAILTAKDFTFEIAYTLRPEDPSRFTGTQTLHDLEVARLGDEAFESLFDGQFSEIVFDLTQGISVEEVIDAVEELDEATGMKVEYPSDYESCRLTVAGVEAEVVCESACLAMKFPRAGSPSELIEAFGQVRHAFALSKKRALVGLLGD